MGKDKNGSFVPRKGKPSGSGHDTHNLKDAFAVTDPEREGRIAEKYTEDGGDIPAAGTHLRHVNRNLYKGEDFGTKDDNN